MGKAPSAHEQRELRALFGVPDGEKLGLDDWGWLRIVAAGFGKQLEENGYFYLSAKELKELSGREPRLMAKHDFSTSRPWIFKKLGLGIIPVSRSEYFVGPLDMYERFPEPTHTGAGSVRTLDMPAGLDTLDIESVNSESMALNVASASGMIEHFLGCKPLQATVAGRMSSLEMTIPVPGVGVKVKVDRAQMEIDGGFESLEHLVIVEAKNHISEDFNIRQLYFPYRRFQQRLSKAVVPVFLVYSNGIFHLYRYDFTDPADFRSIALIDHARYALSSSHLSVDDALGIVGSVDAEPEPTGIPFPQANSFERVVNLVELIAQQPRSKEEIAGEYDFHLRQADYYANAACYLGLMTLADGHYQLTPRGEKAITQPRRDGRNAALLRALAARRVFRQAMEMSLRRGVVAETHEIAAAIEELGLGAVTASRRASTVKQWIQWALDVVAEADPQPLPGL
ncbi:type II restriction enzyme [Corynebacterium macginleyi]|uniref:type II restriction enzyme n=1 Tax=Corynebacterium macginleyi TaxID=38290 RepID=UPI000EF9BFB0|nr:hypothetical protein [Corynebacterium macginleyi]QRP21909.1 hypothetical protein I6J25_03585 [Corynebacterium macginleyi]RMB68957.1 hypothetical protein D9V82_00305 [Corynebacterium macginleyi]